MLGGRLMSGSGKPGVSTSTASASRDRDALARFGEIKQAFTGRVVVNRRADRHRNLDGTAVCAGLIAAFTVAAALGFMFGVIAELQERILLASRNQGDISSAAAIAAARSAPRHIFLTAKRQTAVAAVTGLYQDSGFVEEKHWRGSGYRGKLHKQAILGVRLRRVDRSETCPT